MNGSSPETITPTPLKNDPILQSIAIVLMCVAGAVFYGIIHDQITARICVEYFTIGHPMIIPTNDPTILGLVWGVIATWWVGAILGFVTALASQVGWWPKRRIGSLAIALLIVMACSFAAAVIAGAIGGIAASQDWVFLVGPIADRVPEDRHTAFLIDAWAHGASYLFGFLGAVTVIVRTILWRRREAKQLRE